MGALNYRPGSDFFSFPSLALFRQVRGWCFHKFCRGGMCFFPASTVHKPHPRVQGFRGLSFGSKSCTVLTSFCSLVAPLCKSRRKKSRKSAGFHAVTSQKSDFFKFCFYVCILKSSQVSTHHKCFQRSGMVHLEFINFYRVLAFYSYVLASFVIVKQPLSLFITENIRVTVNNGHSDLISHAPITTTSWLRGTNNPCLKLEIT